MIAGAAGSRGGVEQIVGFASLKSTLPLWARQEATDVPVDQMKN